jgi:hypothetical protein
MAKLGAAPAAQHYCGRCNATYNSRGALTRHLQNHPDAAQTTFLCAVCKWSFDDSLQLEQHAIDFQHPQADTRSHGLKCNRCSQIFPTQQDYNKHRELGQPCSDAMHVNDWKKTPRAKFDDLDKPKVVSREVPKLEYDDNTSETPSDLSVGEVYCHKCKQKFISEARYNRHIISCSESRNKLKTTALPVTPRTPEQGSFTPTLALVNERHRLSLLVPPRTPEQGDISPTVTPVVERHKVLLQVPQPRVPQPNTKTDNLQTSPMQVISLNTRPPVPIKSVHAPPVQDPNTPNASTSNFVCNIGGCERTYMSEKGLQQHQTDIHGSGGQALDLFGKDAWMMNQQERERLKQQGLLRESPVAARGAARGGYRGNRGGRGGRGGRGNRGGGASPVQNRAPFPPGPPQRPQPPPYPSYPPMAQRNYQPTPNAVAPNGPQPLPTSQNMGGQLEMEQAKLICGKMMRLLLQTDVFIHHDGKISVGGILWTRIGVERQRDAVGMFDGMCHLPRVLQSEYLPASKTFSSEYTVQYPVSEFESAPARTPAKLRFDIISLACSKIILEDGRHEVIKMAVVDVLTGRVLMSYLVCTNPHAKVSNWHSSVTGFASFRDIEDARQAGYKVLKGWAAARAALFSFIDKDTIIVGHNLRAELDALRIIHGRAVDMVKVVEKAAGGPLSKAQVSLDSWCRDIADVASLATDPVFGRDCLMNAFAARELGLWVLKNREEFEKKAKQKTRDYQMMM